MQKVIKISALLVVSGAIIYVSYTLYDDYSKKNKKIDNEVKPLFSGGTMGNIGCVVPPCF